MPSPLPPCPYRFPAPESADERGLVAEGGDFEPETIVEAYRRGMFPWPHPDHELLWFSPDPRAILPSAEGLHVSRRLARTIRSGRFRTTVDVAFERVIAGCAERPEGTWITPGIIRAYTRLHELGWAHSFETWTVLPGKDELAGGLYGLRVGRLFGAESMFHRVTDASKVAMVAMVEWARVTGVTLIDVQLLTPHLAAMGAVEVARDEYVAMVRAATRGMREKG